MSQRRWSLAALALAPLLALGACDQIGDVWDRIRGGEAQAPGPAPLREVPLEARALSGAVQPQSDIAALLAPEPVLVAPGEIVLGARTAPALADAAREMGLASSLVRALRDDGEQALGQVPEETRERVRAAAEVRAVQSARDAARDALARLGVQGAVDARPGGLLTIRLATAGVSPTSLRYAQQASETAAADLPNAIEWNEADRCPRVVTQSQLENDIALATRCAILRLRASRQFAYVEPNYIASPGFIRPPRRDIPAGEQGASPHTGSVPNDPLVALQWPYRDRGAGEGQSPGGAGFFAYWQTAHTGSRAVRVAVVDTGIDLTHPDISASGNVAAGIDMIADPERGGDGDGVDADAQDTGDHCGAAREDSFHGTHVAGTIGAAATNDRIGVAGGAWSVTVVPVRVLGRCGGELADIVSGVRWAVGLAPAINAAGLEVVNRNPADIINLSLSLQTPCPASLQAVIDAAVARNALVVVAAGNKANRAALYTPANCNNVIVVAASDGRGTLAFYSNFGPEVDLAAPGGDMFSDSDGDGRPDGVLSTRVTNSGCTDPVSGNSTGRCFYSYLQGTSMAAPHVSAALALLAAENGLRGRDLEGALFARAVRPHAGGYGNVECARAQNAFPRAAGSPTCARPSGRGALDLALAARSTSAHP